MERRQVMPSSRVVEYLPDCPEPAAKRALARIPRAEVQASPPPQLLRPFADPKRNVTMKSNRSLFVLAICAVLGACGTVMPAKQTGFLSSYDRLTSAPGASSAGVRTPLAIDPAFITVGDIEWKAQTSTEISAEERADLLEQLRNQLQQVAQRVPAAPGGRPAVLRASITRVETVSPALNTASTLLLFVPLDRGGAALEMEAIDPTSGRQLAALTLGYFAPMSEIEARFRKLAPAKLALKKATSDFASLLQPTTVNTVPKL